MGFEFPQFDSIEEEQHLQLWAEQLGFAYEFGTQGTVNQPPLEMTTDRTTERIVAEAGLKAHRMRELGCLPAIMDDEERELHVTIKQLARMSEDDKADWYARAEEWLERHPTAVMYNLIDRPPKLP